MESVVSAPGVHVPESIYVGTEIQLISHLSPSSSDCVHRRSWQHLLAVAEWSPDSQVKSPSVCSGSILRRTPLELIVSMLIEGGKPYDLLPRCEERRRLYRPFWMWSTQSFYNEALNNRTAGKLKIEIELLKPMERTSNVWIICYMFQSLTCVLAMHISMININHWLLDTGDWHGPGRGADLGRKQRRAAVPNFIQPAPGSTYMRRGDTGKIPYWQLVIPGYQHTLKGYLQHAVHLAVRIHQQTRLG